MRCIKKILLPLLVIVMLFAAVSCSGTTGKLAKIKSAGKLIVYTDPNFSPFEFLGADSAIVGVDMEIAKAIADEIGVSVQFVEGEFDSLLMAVKGGKGDIAISGFSVTEERKKSVDFSDTYIESVQYLILPEGSDITVLEDLAGKSVGVAKGYTGDLLMGDEIGEKGALAGANTTVKQYNSAMEAALDIYAERIEAVVMDEYVAKNLVEKNVGLIAIPLVYSDGSPAAEEYGVVVPKGNPELLEVINKVIAKLVSEDKISQWVVDFSE